MSKRHWQFIAKDYNSPFIRNYFWVYGMKRQAELLDVPQIQIGIYSVSDDIEYFVDLENWASVHEVLKDRVQKDTAYLHSLIDETNRLGEEMNAWSTKEIAEIDLSACTTERLIELLQEACERTAVVYAYGVTLPILDFQEFAFVEQHLERILKANTNTEEEYRTFYQAFTVPQQRSFAQDQEVALLQLAVEHCGDSQCAELVVQDDVEKIQNQFPEFWDALCAHAQLYGWVYYVYAGPAFGPEEFLESLRTTLQKTFSPAEQLAAIEKREEDARRMQEAFLQKHTVSAEDTALLRLAGKVIWAKPRRKDYQSKTYYHASLIQQEIANRQYMTLRQVRSLLPHQLANPDHHLANEILKEHVCYPDESGETRFLVGAQAKEFRKRIKQHDQADAEEVGTIAGSCAQPGTAQGYVRIINTQRDLEKMQMGDILVSVATTPAIVAAMKKAAAIVTDEGGLTCHAAIVSRELGIPCVIGTKHATRQFQDGDEVSVDATNGIITKL